MDPAIWEALDGAIDDFKEAIATEAEGRVVIERAELLATAATAALEDHDADQIEDVDDGKPDQTVLEAFFASLPDMSGPLLEATLVNVNEMLQASMRELARRKGLGRQPG